MDLRESIQVVEDDVYMWLANSRLGDQVVLEALSEVLDAANKILKIQEA